MATSLHIRVLQIGNYRNIGTRPLYGIKGPFSIELKIQPGRKKLSYLMEHAGGPNGNHRIDVKFESITRFAVGTTTFQMQHEKGNIVKQEDEVPFLELELSEVPTFLQETNGKYIKGEDFTGGQATHHRVHVLLFHSKVDSVVRALEGIITSSDHAIGVSEDSIADSMFVSNYPQCDNDGENVALVMCDECKEHYCRECDEIIHRNPKKRMHFRKPLTGPEAKKRKNVGKCRCGSGAKRDPTTVCQTKRCPCYAESRGCFSCGCKSCTNPFNTYPDDEDVSSSQRSPKQQKVGHLPLSLPAMTTTLPVPVNMHPTMGSLSLGGPLNIPINSTMGPNVPPLSFPPGPMNTPLPSHISNHMLTIYSPQPAPHLSQINPASSPSSSSTSMSSPTNLTIPPLHSPHNKPKTEEK